MQDMNARDLDAATKIVLGTARSMGIEVEKLGCRPQSYKQ